MEIKIYEFAGVVLAKPCAYCTDHMDNSYWLLEKRSRFLDEEDLDKQGRCYICKDTGMVLTGHGDTLRDFLDLCEFLKQA